MALFKTALRLAWDLPNTPPRKWSNTFFVEAPTAVEAADNIVGAWTAALQGAASVRVYAYEVYATDLLPNTTNFTTVPIPVGQQRGSRSIVDLGEPYIPKACVSVNINVPNSRPSRKFWRPGLFEADVVNGTSITPGLRAAIEGAFIIVVNNNPNLRDPDGQFFSDVGSLRLTTRNFGRESTNLVPLGPALG